MLWLRARGRREREDLVRSSSLSGSPWAMLMCAYFFFFLSLYPTLTLAQETESDLFTLYNTTCGGDSIQDNSAFTSNQATVFSTLGGNSSSYRYSFYKTSYGNEDLQGFYQCRGDLTLDLCDTCVSLITNGTKQNTCGTTSSFRMDTGVYSFLSFLYEC